MPAAAPPANYQRDVTHSGADTTSVATVAGTTAVIPNELDAAFMEEARKNMKVMEEKTKVTHNLFGVLFKVGTGLSL